MNPNERAAFIMAQTQMRIAERDIMKAEDLERARAGHSPANGPEQWHEFHDKWEPVLGYNALIAFLQ